MVIRLIYKTIVNLVAITYLFNSPLSYSQDLLTGSKYLNAINFLGEDYMSSPNHQVRPQAFSNGYMLEYEILNNNKIVKVLGTKQTKIYIREIQATEALQNRSTAFAILLSAKNRTTNLVETPIRVSKTIGRREAR